MEVKYPHIKVKLVGEDGNALVILGRIQRAMKDNGISKEEISQFVTEATAGDYDHLLCTCTQWVTCE